MKPVVIVALILLVALPVAAMATILLASSWGWLEAKTGIESLGHSGPASWCYGAVYGVMVLTGLGIFFGLRKKQP